MNKKAVILAGFFLLIGMVFFPGCPTNNGDDNGPQSYTLSVTVSSGVSGNPTTGFYSYVENSMVNYSYSLQPGYKNLTVTLDGVPMAATGVITVTGNHVLSAKADQIDIRATWTGKFYYLGIDTYFQVDFSGNTGSGNCGGHFDFVPIGGAGTWTLVWPQIDFVLKFPAPYNTTLTCTGTLTDENHMNGTWIYTPPGVTGDWSLERQ